MRALSTSVLLLLVTKTACAMDLSVGNSLPQQLAICN